MNISYSSIKQTITILEYKANELLHSMAYCPQESLCLAQAKYQALSALSNQLADLLEDEEGLNMLVDDITKFEGTK